MSNLWRLLDIYLQDKMIAILGTGDVSLDADPLQLVQVYIVPLRDVRQFEDREAPSGVVMSREVGRTTTFHGDRKIHYYKDYLYYLLTVNKAATEDEAFEDGKELTARVERMVADDFSFTQFSDSRGETVQSHQLGETIILTFPSRLSQDTYFCISGTELQVRSEI